VTDPVDLAVVGGGPVGLGVAIQAAQRGLSAVVFDLRPPPRDKACGEGIMPLGVAELRRLGIRLPLGVGQPFRGIRYLDGETRAQGRFPDGDGLGLRRTSLVGLLEARARELGAELRSGCRVTGWELTRTGIRVDSDRGSLEARLLVGADGLRSRVRRRAGLESAPGRGRVGIRRHFRVSRPLDFVEVHWADGIEAYLTPVASDEIGVALLHRGARGSFAQLAARIPSLRALLDGAEPISAVRGAGPFHQRARRRFTDRIALVGDAAGYLDPLTGEGVSLGLRSAGALVDAFASGRPLADYEREWRRLSARYFQLTRMVLWLAASPALRRRVVRVLARHPELFDRFLATAEGSAPLRSIGMSGVLRLLVGLVA
jgi:flavin-dependent dehydrogenase